ncbi:hypothetical protein ABEG10_00090 [Burkholderia cenocepacia]|uniref:hypothetical protein n=1 Tax=Burkholderia cenocepacia TaxID=95486 RepID=UPI001FB6F0CA|nr:hypothetical protein [Burkholderia cenocepacia]MDR5642162.1 hypothetical protein [Burkholderia cenocepacia]
MGTTARIILKAILSIPIAFGLAYPFISPSEDGGILGEMAVFGTIGSIVVVAVFLWVWHWVFVRRVNKMLAGSQVSVATLPGRTGS